MIRANNNFMTSPNQSMITFIEKFMKTELIDREAYTDNFVDNME